VFERFTARARQVVVFAQEEARALRHGYIGTEHLVLGLLREEEGLAARVLESLDITVERVRAQVVYIVGSPAEEVTSGQIPFTPRAKRVLELALQEAQSLGHNYIGTEHILLGLVRENEGVAARILLDFDADAEKIRNEVIRMLSGPGPGARRQAQGSRRGVVVSHPAVPAVEYRLDVGLAPPVRRLLMVAAARALDDGRTDTQLRDVLLALMRDDETAGLLAQYGVDAAAVREAIEGSDTTDEPPAASAEG
jgi:ATP-dependent Clp protease ATP-binding subunit ClpC